MTEDDVTLYREMVDRGDWKLAAKTFREKLGDSGFEALKAAASEPPPSGRTECPNCGAGFTMPKTAVAGRAKAGWCTGCWGQREKACHVRSDGTEYWTTGRASRSRFDARPRYGA